MAGITIKQGEGKWIRFTVTQDGVAVDLSTATCRFCVKEAYSDSTYLIDKGNSDFDKTNAATGIVRVNISATESAALDPGRYLGELRNILVAGTDVDLSATITITVQQAVMDD